MKADRELTSTVIRAAIEVHRELGPGLLESTYEQCLAHEFRIVGLNFRREARMPVRYKGVSIDCGYRLDFVVEEVLIVELKSVDQILKVFQAQLLTYMRLSSIKVGLLINFNVLKLTDGIKRMVL